jgi:DNA gyrase subunit A
MTDTIDHKIPEPIDIEDEMRASYLDYAMSVIIGRALPDVRDGLKPVHRRVLFAMHELGNHYNRAYKKSARIVGDVIGKYHPHGDQAAYDTLVRMAQDFSLRHMLIDGQGNFGSVDGDSAAAMRYTESRMSKLASEMLADIDKETVDFGPNYDDSLEEPLVLPTRFPNLLVNGSSGIAVGMATNIAPHNLGEVVDGAIALIHNADMTVLDLMEHIPGPDFPTGGIVYGTGALRTAYETGRGIIHVRAKAEVVDNKGKDRIVVHELPYQVNKAHLVEKVAHLVRDKRIEGISDIRDESDRDGMRVVIECKKDAFGEVILNQLYRLTSLQTSFGYNMLAIVDGQPRVLSLKDMLRYFIDHRRDVVTRRCQFELREARKRFNTVFGLLAAIDSIDRIVEIIRAAKDQPEAKANIMAEKLPMSPAFTELCERLLTFDYETGKEAVASGHVTLNERQAQAILDMRLARLTGLERDKLANEAEELRDIIERLVSILSSDELLMQVIEGELVAVKEEYQNPRRTELVLHGREISAEDLVADEPCVVTVSHAGYVKRVPLDVYQAQNRGGRGKTAATTRSEDFVENIYVASTHSYVLIFTDQGKVYWLKVHEIPTGSRTSRGKPIVNLIKIDKGEKISAILPVREFEEGHYLMFATKLGYIKKTDMMSFAKPRSNGLIALTIDEEDTLINVVRTTGESDILVGTRMGMAIRFGEDDVRPMGRTARGVRAIKLKKEGDAVVGMVVPNEEAPDVLTICDNGYGKRTHMDEYRKQGRSGSGIISLKISERTGLVSGVVGVSDKDDIMVITSGGVMIRTSVDQISQLGRSTQGVRIINIDEGGNVASIARIVEPEEEEIAEGDEAATETTDAPEATDAPEETVTEPEES